MVVSGRAALAAAAAMVRVIAVVVLGLTMLRSTGGLALRRQSLTDALL